MPHIYLGRDDAERSNWCHSVIHITRPAGSAAHASPASCADRQLNYEPPPKKEGLSFIFVAVWTCTAFNIKIPFALFNVRRFLVKKKPNSSPLFRISNVFYDGIKKTPSRNQEIKKEQKCT